VIVCALSMCVDCRYTAHVNSCKPLRSAALALCMLTMHCSCSECACSYLCAALGCGIKIKHLSLTTTSNAAFVCVLCRAMMFFAPTSSSCQKQL
jgi:hypothetical protein